MTVAAAAGNPMFDVQYGPQAVQWCSARTSGGDRGGVEAHRPPHPHASARDQIRSAPGSTPTIRAASCEFLDEIGLLAPRLTLAHCTWARPDELELIAARGATISVNTSSNLHLRSGIAPLKEMVQRGCRVALGLDGSTFDEDDDALREMRLAYLLHQGIAFTTDVDRPAMLRMAFQNGRLSVTNKDDGGALARRRSRPISWSWTGTRSMPSACGPTSTPRTFCSRAPPCATFTS